MYRRHHIAASKSQLNVELISVSTVRRGPGRRHTRIARAAHFIRNEIGNRLLTPREGWFKEQQSRLITSISRSAIALAAINATIDSASCRRCIWRSQRLSPFCDERFDVRLDFFDATTPAP